MSDVQYIPELFKTVLKLNKWSCEKLTTKTKIYITALKLGYFYKYWLLGSYSVLNATLSDALRFNVS